jgi:predicted nucleic acid-binding protein
VARKIFVDSSGLYALADRRDSSHVQAKERVGKLVESGTGLVLTDYIVDEACTLAKIRAGSDAALRLLEIVERSRAIEMLWIGIEQFEAAKAVFRRHADHGYSFTDCTSFVVMDKLRIRDALTSDHHFVQAGFRILLKPG